jgi:hypothetical protein
MKRNKLFLRGLDRVDTALDSSSNEIKYSDFESEHIAGDVVIQHEPQEYLTLRKDDAINSFSVDSQDFTPSYSMTAEVSQTVLININAVGASTGSKSENASPFKHENMPRLLSPVEELTALNFSSSSVKQDEVDFVGDLSDLIVSVGGGTGDVVLKYELPEIEYMSGCAATAMGMLVGYYDRYGYTDENGNRYAMVNAVTGGRAELDARGSDGNIFNMNEFQTLLGTTVASQRHYDDFFGDPDSGYEPSTQHEKEALFVDGTWTFDTDRWDCIADYMGTSQFWRSNENYSSIIYYASLEDIYVFDTYDGWETEISDGTDTYILEPSNRSTKVGMDRYFQSKGYTLDRAQTVTYRTDTNWGDFTFEDYMAEIDAGRVVMVGITGHAMTGYGYNAATREILFDDTYRRGRMVWDGSYNYAGADRTLGSITTIVFDTSSLNQLPVLSCDLGTAFWDELYVFENSSSSFLFTDTDDVASDIIYKITDSVNFGTLFIDANEDGIADVGEKLLIGSSFTQDDINTGKMKFLSGNNDTSFKFTVRNNIVDLGNSAFDMDDQYFVSDEYTFNINWLGVWIPPSTPVELGDEVTGQSVKLDWDDSEDSDGYIVKYVVQISDNENFTSFTQRESADSEFTFDGLLNGAYYWRVKAVDNSTASSEWSEVDNFDIAVEDTTKPSVPINLVDSYNNGTLALNWADSYDDISKIAGYEIEYSTDPNFIDSEKITKLNVQSSEAAIENLDSAVYYWRVRAIDAAGNISDWSEVEDIRVINPPVNKLIAADGAQRDNFGYAVAAGKDIIVVGARCDDMNGTNSGSAYIYNWNGSGYDVTEISDGLAMDFYGNSVAIGGTTIAVGAICDDDKGSDAGGLYAYRYDSENKIYDSYKLTDSYGADYDAFSVSVDTTEDVVIAGSSFGSSAYLYQFAGSVRLYWWDDELKSYDQITILEGWVFEGDQFGSSVAITEVSGDRCLFIAGAYGADWLGSESGAVYIYSCSESKQINEDGPKYTYLPLHSSLLLSYDGAAGDKFGCSVDLTDDIYVVGACGDDDNGAESGSVYVYTYDYSYYYYYDVDDYYQESGTISNSLRAKLTASDGQAGDMFGYSVAASGDYVVVGACGDDDMGENSGSVYVFKWNGFSYDSIKITAVDGGAGDEFGTSVAIYGTTLVVGVIGDDDKAENAGAVYYYDLNDYNFDNITLPGAPTGLVSTTEADTAQLDWNDSSDSDGIKEYYLQYSDSFNFANAESLTVTESEADINGLTDGATYFWRVKAIDNLGYGSAWSSFGVFAISLPDTEAPTRPDALSSEVVGGNVALSWTASQDNKGVAGYLVEYSLNKDFSGSVTVEPASNQLDMNSLDNGYYYWRVAALDAAGNTSEWSRGASFELNNVTVDGFSEYELGASSSDDDFFGSAVDIAGQWALVRGNDSASVYLWDGAGWNNSSDLDVSSISAGVKGGAAAIDNGWLFIGNSNTDGATPKLGAVSVYHDSQWNDPLLMESSYYTNEDGTVSAADIDGEWLIVGAQDKIINDESRGGVYIFRYTGNTIVEEAFLSPGNADYSNFGISVSVSGNKAVVGFIKDNVDSASGGANFYSYDGSEWNLEATVISSPMTDFDQGGYSVSISGDWAILGNPGEGNGTATIMRWTGIAWYDYGKIVAYDGMVGDGFGSDVSISGDWAIVGAKGDDVNGADSGSAYIYRRNGISWDFYEKIDALNGSAGDFFGSSVAIDDNWIAVGSNDSGDGASGSATIFKKLDPSDTIAPAAVQGLSDSIDGNNVALDWANASDASGVKWYEVRVSSSSGFDSLEYYNISEASQVSLSDWGEGVWYWQVRAQDEEHNWGEWSTTESFSIMASPSVPKDLVQSNNGALLYLDWADSTDASGIKKYQVQISEYADFRELVYNDYSAESEVSLNAGTGTYYWRVKAFDNWDNESGWSSAKSFEWICPDIYEYDNSFADANITELDGVLQDHTIHSGSDKDYLKFHVAQRCGVTIQLNCGSELEGYLYSSGNEPSIIVSSFSSTLNRELSAGWYYVMVKGKYWGITPAEYSISVVYDDETAPETPIKLTQKINDNAAVLDWADSVDVDSGVYGYQVQLASDADFSSIVIDDMVTDNSAWSNNDLSDGTYFWRVRALDNSNKFSDWSTSTNSFTIDEVEDAPTNLNCFVTWVSYRNIIILERSKPQNGNEYYIQIDNDADFSSPIVKRQTNGSFSFVEFSGEGIFNWRMQTVNDSGRSEWVYGESFSYDNAAPDCPDELQVQVDGEALQLSWNDVTDFSGIYYYEIQVDDNANFTSPIVAAQTEVASFTTSAFESGTYYCRVRAMDESGNLGDWSSTWSFSRVHPDSYESDNTFNTAKTVVVDGVVQEHTIHSAGDEDYFKFNINQKADVAIQLNCSEDFERYIYYLSGNELGIVAQDFDSLVNCKLDAGWYYVVVKGREGDFVPGEYTFSIAYDEAIAPTVPSELSQKIEGNDIELGWADSVDEASGLHGYQIQLANDAGFSSIVVDDTVTDGSSWSSNDLLDGTYYWRVRSQDYAGNVSEWSSLSSSFVINEVDGIPTTLVSSVSSEDGQEIAGLSWSEVNGAAGYYIEIDNDADFSSPVATRQSANITESFEFDDEGSFHWRIRAFNDAGSSEWVYGNDFSYDNAAPEGPDELQVEFNVKTVEFSWNYATDYSGIDYYEIQVDDNAEFSSPVASEQLKSTNWTVSELEIGTYYWRVRAMDNKGNTGEWSASESFIAPDCYEYDNGYNSAPEITLDGVVQEHTIHWSGDKDYVKFQLTQATGVTIRFDCDEGLAGSLRSYNDDFTTCVSGLGSTLNRVLSAGSYYILVEGQYWNSEPGEYTISITSDTIAPDSPIALYQEVTGNDAVLGWTESVDNVNGSGLYGYQVQLANDKNFSSVVIDDIVTDDSAWSNNDLLDGSYYWRVRAIDKVENSSEWSVAADSFVIDEFEGTLTGLDFSLALKSEAGAEVEEWIATLSWDEVDDATGYYVEVDNNYDFSSPLLAGQSKDTAKLFEFYGDGMFYWRVRAFNDAGNSEWFYGETFTNDDKKPAAPSNLSAQIDDGNIELSWGTVTDDTGIDYYELQIDDAADFTSLLAMEQTSGSSYDTSSFDSGSYYWRVRAVDGAGNIGSWSNSGNFEVESAAAVETVGTPSGLSTQVNGENIELSWGAVTDDTGIDYYELQIDDAADFTSLLASEQTSGLSYDTSTLDSGAYYWRVRAVDDAGNIGDWSYSENFEVESAAAVEIVGTPSELSQTVSGREAILDWEAASSGTESEYVLEYSCNNDFTDATSRTVTESDFTLNALPEGVYYWHVKATDDVGNSSEWSEASTFVIEYSSRYSDFDGNGKDDILFTNGNLIGYYADGLPSGWKDLGSFASGWSVTGCADFDGNGKDDIMFTNGNLLGYYADGLPSGWKDIGGFASGWSVTGCADFDGNGQDDILFTNGNLIGYYADGLSSDWKDLGGFASGWSVAGCADFDGNGKDDILFTNGNLIGYYADGLSSGWKDLGGFAAGWSVIDCADFDGNGKDDILFTNGNLIGYYADGLPSGWKDLGGFASGWSVSDCADFDGNGKDDILFTNDNLLGYYADGLPSGWHDLGGFASGWEIVIA